MRSASVLLEHLVLMLQNCFPSQQLSQCKQGDDQSSSECKQQQGYCGCVLRATKKRHHGCDNQGPAQHTHSKLPPQPCCHICPVMAIIKHLTCQLLLLLLLLLAG
jgi:hypothetical protein